ncbi:CPBP family glutamic-type intramembrane protease [Mongoliitalea daihaiensis]|uniref:CPBP family glutamic-type intramembrane protease n=1 Tax=Mongoliitalea daihaiensis TaxID=2782006 RepID=UPI001F1B6AE9|nr:CPBP family glutamic-type intramembrane protease [Mongoliitalea daihaiensis]UJP66762.1 CPBP family intramembrane metalloprotease [Mongoliitalea daihaiensis]
MKNWKDPIRLFIENHKHRVPLQLLLCFFAMEVFYTITSSWVVNWLVDDSVFEIDFLQDMSTTEIFWVAVFLGPLLETFLFQYLIIELVFWFESIIKKQIPLLIPILLSAIPFGLTHDYNTYYLVTATISGVIFAFFYIMAKQVNGLNPFWSVFSVHAAMNLVSFILNQFYE